MLKAQFNVEKIVRGNVIYAKSFVDLVLRYEGKVIEVEEEVFGGYELELEGKTYALDDEELIILNK